MGTVFRYKNSKYWWIQFCKNGKAYRESSKSTDYDYAGRLLKVKEGKIAQGQDPGLNIHRTRIDDMADLYLKDYETNDKKSLKDAKRYAKHINGFFGGRFAVDLTTTDIMAYRDKRKADNSKIKDSTVNREISALRRMYRLGLEHEPPLVNRIPKMKLIKEKNVRTGFFELGDFRELRAKAPDHLKPVITLAFYTGMRAGEILSLTWDRVDLVNGILRLETGTTKTERGREVPLVPDLAKTMEWWKKETEAKYPHCPYVCHYKGERYKSYKRAWNTVSEAVGLLGSKMHDFRRSAIRNLTRAGVPQAVAMQISGHKTDSVYRRYDIVSHQDIKQAGERLTLYLQENAKDLKDGRESDRETTKATES